MSFNSNRIQTLTNNIQACIDAYKQDVQSNVIDTNYYLYEFRRYKMMLDILTEDNKHPELEELCDTILPRILRELYTF